MNVKITLSVIAMLASAGAAVAQNAQADKPFFAQLQKSGVKTQNVKPDDFRKKLETRGINQQKPLSVREFFEQMTLQGAKVPESFDREAFFKKMQTQGVEVPDYIQFGKGY